jgi:hypothetical protein
MDPNALTRYSGNVEGMAVYMAVWMALQAVGAVPIGHPWPAAMVPAT